MKFIEWLNSIDEFDGEVIVSDLYESNFSFCWSKGYVKLTAEGKEQFKRILESEIRINKDCIILQDKNIKEGNYELFMASVTGYVACSDYDKWFQEIKKSK